MLKSPPLSTNEAVIQAQSSEICCRETLNLKTVSFKSSRGKKKEKEKKKSIPAPAQPF